MTGHRAIKILGVLFGLSVVIPLAAMQPAVVAAKGSCTGWQSTLVPPESIRVWRRATGVVEVVPYPDYVVTVMGKEWPGYLPLAVIEAGAVAVKQYGWFYAMEGRHRKSYVTESGECFDVKDTTADQLYKPEKARVVNKHYAARDKTWDYSLRKDNKQFLTGYRRGSKGECASNATGWKLFARTAVQCANELGYDWMQILHAYYGPGLQIVHQDGTIVGSDGEAIGDAAIIGSALQPGGSPGKFDERHAAIEWNGAWQRTKADQAYKRTLTYSSDQNASAVFQIAARSLELIGRKGPKRGRLRVYVDGNLKGTIDLWAPERQHQQTIFSWTWKADQVSTVRLELAGPADRPRIDLDAIVVSR